MVVFPSRTIADPSVVDSDPGQEEARRAGSMHMEDTEDTEDTEASREARGKQGRDRENTRERERGMSRGMAT
jgi:hypothetical protein